jgi:phage-related protein
LEIGRFLTGTIGAATDLNETISKSNTVFGDNAKEVEDWAGTSAKSFGQSKEQSLGAAAQFGNMFKQLGIGGKEAAGMSKQMVELASDFASFHNADISDVLEAQSAAFRGEYDSVQRFVPTITAAAVEQKALALGLAGSTKELTAQDKAIATQALLLEGAGDATGDFARTSSGLANQQRIMSAQWADLTASIGTAFIPIATKVVDFVVSSLLPALSKFGGAAGEVFGKIKEAFKSGGLGAAIDEVGNQFGRLWEVVKPRLEAFFSAIGPWLEARGPGILRGLRDGWLKFAEFMATEFFPFLLPKLGQMLAALGKWIVGTAWPYLAAQLLVWGQAFGEWVEKTAIPWLQANLPKILAAIGVWITGTALPALGRMAKDMAIELVKFAAETAAKIPGEMVKILAELGRWALETAASIPGIVFGIGVAIVRGIVNGILSVAGEVAAFFLALPGNILSWIGDAASWLIQKGSDYLHGLNQGLLNVVGEVAGWFQRLPGNILTWIGDTFQTLIGKGSDFLHGLKQGFENAVGQVSSWIVSLPGRIRDWIGDTLSTLREKGADVIRGFIDGITSWIGSIAGHISGIPGRVRDSIGDTASALYAKGQQLIQGFINGIESLAGRAESAASRIISAAARSVPIAGQIAGLVGLAAGGIVTKPTIALIGEAGPEAVIPLSMFNEGVQFGRYPQLAPAAIAGPPVGAAGMSSVVVNAQTNADPWQIASEVRWAQKTAGV